MTTPSSPVVRKESHHLLQLKGVLWLVPIFITVHNLEEALFIPGFLEKRNSAIPFFLRGIVPQVTYKQFLIALLIVTALPYLIAVLWNGSVTGIYLLLGLQVVMFINVFAHFMTAIFMGGYAPGVITALAFNLPFSIYLLKRAWTEGWISKRAIVWLFPLGVLIHGPVLIGLIILSGELANRL